MKRKRGIASHTTLRRGNRIEKHQIARHVVNNTKPMKIGANNG
jgi:hypothetical protein